MACSPVINMTRDRDSNDMFVHDLVSRRSIEPCVKMPYNGDSNDMFAPYVRGGEWHRSKLPIYSSMYARRRLGNIEERNHTMSN